MEAQRHHKSNAGDNLELETFREKKSNSQNFV